MDTGYNRRPVTVCAGAVAHRQTTAGKCFAEERVGVENLRFEIFELQPITVSLVGPPLATCTVVQSLAEAEVMK